MGTLSEFFGWTTGQQSPDKTFELPDLFPLDITKQNFIKYDVLAIFTKILTDVTERMNNIDDKFLKTFWDSCLKSDASKGLISTLADAMYNRSDLFLVYDKPTGLMRQATNEERKQIEADYKKTASSKIGVFVSFSNNTRIEMIKLFSALQYCLIGNLNKSLNTSNALQLKINDLRASVSSVDINSKDGPFEQAQKIATALKNGKSVLLDAKDIIELASVDMGPTVSAQDFINQKLSLYLGLPSTYITGVKEGGLGDGDSQDSKAVERGLKNYYLSIMKPVTDALFGINVGYKSQDFMQISQGLEALKTFDLVDQDNQYMDAEDKRRIVMGLFDIDTKEGRNKD